MILVVRCSLIVFIIHSFIASVTAWTQLATAALGQLSALYALRAMNSGDCER